MIPSEQHLGFLVTDVARLMRRRFEQRLVGSTLTLAQARALIQVHRHEGVRQVDLAELLEVQPITLARLIDQLAEAGLVERRADPADRRAYRIHLTGAAQGQLDAIRAVAAQVRAEATQGLSAAQSEALLLALARLRENLAAT